MAAGLLLTVAIVLVIIGVIFREKKNNKPPGPYPWPIIGNVHLVRRLSRQFGAQHLAFSELCRQYGSNVINFRLATSNIIVVSGLDCIQKVLYGDEYDGRPWNEFIKLRNMGAKRGISMVDGPEWREMRAWLMRAFRTIGFGRDEMTYLIKDEIMEVLENLKDGGVRRLKPVIAPAVINVIWTLATGKRLCDGQKLQTFIAMMERRARLFDMSGGILSTFPWLRYFAPEYTGYNLLVTLNNELKGFLMETIEEHKKNYVAGKENDLIDIFLREMYTGKGPASGYNEQQLVMILMDLFIAGASTTATTLDFLFLAMTTHQDKQRLLHQEIDKVIGLERLPDLDDRPKLVYTEAVLTETQRRFTIMPIIGPRRVLRDTKLQDYTIPQNATILINIYSVHMDPLYYPDPDKFEPERFVKDGAFEADDKLLFFGRGRRRCPGEILAKSATYMLFVGVMQRFQLLPVPGQEPPDLAPLPGLTFSPKPYEVLLVPRKLPTDDCTAST